MTLPETTTPEALVTRMIDQQPLYDLPGAAMKLGNCSRSTLYRLIEQGKIVRVNIGTKAVITGESIAGYIEELKSTRDLTPESKLHRRKRKDTDRDTKIENA